MQPSLSSSKVNKLTSIFFNINHSSCQHVSQYLFPLIYLHFFFFNVSRRHTEQRSIDIDDIMHLSSLAAKRKFNILVFIRFCVKEKAFKKILPGKIKLLAVRKQFCERKSIATGKRYEDGYPVILIEFYGKFFTLIAFNIIFFYISKLSKM